MKSKRKNADVQWKYKIKNACVWGAQKQLNQQYNRIIIEIKSQQERIILTWSAGCADIYDRLVTAAAATDDDDRMLWTVTVVDADCVCYSLLYIVPVKPMHDAQLRILLSDGQFSSNRPIDVYFI